MQQCVYETKIHDIDDLQKRLMQTWFDFEQDIIKAEIDQWCDRLRSFVHAGRYFGHNAVFVYMIHQNIFIKLSMESDAFNGYFMTAKRNLCSYAFSVFCLSQGSFSVATLIDKLGEMYTITCAVHF